MNRTIFKGTEVRILADKWNPELQKMIDNGSIALGVVNWTDRSGNIASVIDITVDGEPLYHYRPQLKEVLYTWQSSMDHLEEISTCVK